ncbi:MAG: sugar nucleotide-binding protein [Gammaproteobacteria bacterium]|nr:sugar nucleotide-binding protein [Gammaproteobacteria bacterium]
MNHEKKQFLVIGGDSLIGNRLANMLSTLGYKVFTTTRRCKHDAEFFYDLENGNCNNLFNEPFACAFLCVGITDMAACHADPEHSYLLNVTNTVNLADRLRSVSTPFVFLSSNTVFDGAAEYPDEYSGYCFNTEYGRQKAAAEQALLAFGQGTSIVRLSKVLARDSGIVAKFLQCFKARQTCDAFNDLFIAPVSLNYVCQSLIKIAQSGIGGIFHLSGQNEISYADLAFCLADSIPGARACVRSISSTASNSLIIFKPSHPALGMTRTINTLGILPESVGCVLTQLNSISI